MLPLIALALLSGVAVALQAQFMGTMGRGAGTVTSVFVTYGLGALVAAAIWSVRGEPLLTLKRVPAYSWTAGGLGLVIVGGIAYATPRLGLSRTIILTIAAQLLVAMVIDHYGVFGAQRQAISAVRVAGAALTMAGAWLVVKP